MGVASPATSTVPGLAMEEQEKLTVERLGLRRLVTCRIGSSLLSWLQSRAGAETPGAIGDVFVRAVADGVPTLQSKGLPSASKTAKMKDDADGDGGRLIAFAVDSGLVQTLAEIAGDEGPAAVEATAIAAAMATAAKSGGARKTSTRRRRTSTTTRRQAKSTATTAAQAAEAAAGSAEATPQSGETATRRKSTAKQSRRSSSSRRPAQAKQPQLQPLAPDVAAELEAGELSSRVLRALRESLGFSQAAAALALGVSRGLVADAERGRRAGQQTLARLIGGLRRLRAETEEAAAKNTDAA
ncbi:MAG: hypothetical protein CL878_00645 [Dehalococcoidia bacterium]|nr:hypothetical protein [Dehalococcoidia bacterium]